MIPGPAMLRRALQATMSTLAICACCAWAAADDDPVRGAEQVAPLGRTLKVLEKEVCGKSFAVTGTGAVWAFVPDGAPRFHEGKRVSATQPLFLGYDDDLESIIDPPAENRIAFFDKQQWHVVPWTEPLSQRDRNGPYGRIVAGVDNTVLVVGTETSLLVRGTRVVDHGDLWKLVESHSDLIRESFGLGVPHPTRRDRWRRHTLVVADQHGRIWCLHDERLRVLVDGQWLDCRESLIEAGSRHGFIDFIVPGPDHGYMFIGDHKLRHDGGVSFIASVEGERVVLKPAPHAIEGMGQYPALREANDALWIASPEGRSGGVSDIFTGQSAVRVDRNGKVTDVVRMSGYPLLSDPVGNVWLGGIRGGPEDRLNIVRDGKIAQQLKAPTKLGESSHDHDYMPVFCDSKGSVFAHAEHTLTQFVAEQQPPHRYRMASRYVWGETKGRPQAFSSQGYCISLVADDDVPLKMMYLTKLP